MSTENVKNVYKYPASPTGRYVLSRDGVEVKRGAEGELWRYLHDTHCFSVEHALRYEGYDIKPEP